MGTTLPLMINLTTMLFFVFVGMMVDIRIMAEHWTAILGLAGAVLLLKPLATFGALLHASLDSLAMPY
jgi:Kef-type K+ transport system membrane component KefB